MGEGNSVAPKDRHPRWPYLDISHAQLDAVLAQFGRDDRMLDYQNRIAELEDALKPFARYAEMRGKQPLGGLGDVIHGIHHGSEFEAEIRFSACVRALAVLVKKFTPGLMVQPETRPDGASDEDRAGREPAKDWVIRKNGYFYRPNRSGYTHEICAAGRYTEAEAKAEAAIEPWCISAHLASEFSGG
jgi:hypothetical protein